METFSSTAFEDCSPVTHRAVLIEDPLRQLLLKWMLRDGSFIDLDAKAGFLAGRHCARLAIDGMEVAYDLGAPRHIFTDGFADRVIGLRKAELERCRSADRSLRIVGRQGDAIGLRQSCDLPRRGQATAMRDVGLRHITAVAREQIPELIQRRQTLARWL